MGRRFAIGMAVGLLLTASVAPAASALGYNDDPFKGTVGAFAGPAYPEVVCRYDSAGRLNSLTVRPLTLYGSHDQPTNVGFQFQIREATLFQAGRLVYKSPIARQLASTTMPSSFANRRHTVTESLEGTRAYYVLPVMKFFAPGSRTTVEGKAVLIYDGYLQKMGDQSFWSNACTFDFGLIWEGD
jgi:hypothetical protein